MPQIITNIFDRSTGFLEISLKSTIGDEDLFSTKMNTTREAEPRKARMASCQSWEIVFPVDGEDGDDDDVCTSVRADRKEVMVMTRNITPLISSLAKPPLTVFGRFVLFSAESSSSPSFSFP